MLHLSFCERPARAMDGTTEAFAKGRVGTSRVTEGTHKVAAVKRERRIDVDGAGERVVEGRRQRRQRREDRIGVGIASGDRHAGWLRGCFSAELTA